MVEEVFLSESSRYLLVRRQRTFDEDEWEEEVHEEEFEGRAQGLFDFDRAVLVHQEAEQQTEHERDGRALQVDADARPRDLDCSDESVHEEVDDHDEEDSEDCDALDFGRLISQEYLRRVGLFVHVRCADRSSS